MTEAPFQPQPTKQGINWKNILIGAIIGGVLVGVIGALVFYLYQSNSEETTPTTTPKTSTPSAKISTPSAKKDETDDWKTYSNSALGFSFRYPPIFNTYDISNLPCLSNTGKPNLVVVYKDTLDENCYFVEVIPHNIFFSVKDEKVDLTSLKTEDSVEVIVGGEKGIKFSLKKPSPPLTQIYFNHVDKTYVASIMNKDFDGNYDPIYDTVLSTFKFLD